MDYVIDRDEMARKIVQIIVDIFAVIGFLLTAAFFAIKYGVTNTTGIIDNQREDFINAGKQNATTSTIAKQNIQQSGNLYWITLPEWQTIKDAVVKDKILIYQTGATTGITPRLIVAQLVVEQLRLFYTERESYKKFFEPLKILGSQTKFSWGVMGIKEDTAVQIENHLKDSTSQFYLGKSFENLLDFKTSNITEERFTRMTDQHAHYYSYLYAALFLKQIETQWRNAGIDISKRPEIMTTLYNIGFSHSVPKPNPQSGGVEIKIYDHVYSFGSLGVEFYNSNELIEEFPR